jgi:hypothetical protein
VRIASAAISSAGTAISENPSNSFR